MEVNLNSLFPLERMTFVVLVVTLWKKETIRNLISKLNFQLHWDALLNKWAEIESEVLEHANLVSVPQPFKCKLLTFIKPIGFEILAWMEFHVHHCNIHFEPPKEFCWTSRGTIDRRKTAQMLVNDINLEISARYEFACLYSLENDILLLWGQLEETYKRNAACIGGDKSLMVQYWSWRMKRQGNLKGVSISRRQRLISSFRLPENAFKMPDVCRNDTAIKVLLQISNSEDEDNILVDTVLHVSSEIHDMSNSYVSCIYLSNTLLFLLSVMNEEHKIMLFSRRDEYIKGVILQCFLNWPLQEMFLKMAENMWTLLDKRDHFVTLLNILYKIERWETYNYNELFGMFWCRVPAHHRSSVCFDLLYNFLTFGSSAFDPERGMKIIVNSLTDTEKHRIILNSDCPRFVCMTLLHKQRNDLLEFLLQECLTSNNVMEEFRRNCERELLGYFITNKDRIVRSTFYKMLDNIQDKISP